MTVLAVMVGSVVMVNNMNVPHTKPLTYIEAFILSSHRMVSIYSFFLTGKELRFRDAN